MQWGRDYLRMMGHILEVWLNQWFTTDEVLHVLVGLAVGLLVVCSPWWLQALEAPLLVGYSREVCQGQAAGHPSPWNPWRWSDHRLRELAAWGVGGWLALLTWGAYGNL